MKRVIAAVVFVLAMVAGILVFRTVEECPDWQDRYKRFLYSEWIKISPFVYTPEMIEEVIGDRPLVCETPSGLSQTDVRRYRREGVGPNYFLEESRS